MTLQLYVDTIICVESMKVHVVGGQKLSFEKQELITVAICNRADHYSFALWFLSSILFFPRLISAVGDWISTILPHMVWP